MQTRQNKQQARIQARLPRRPATLRVPEKYHALLETRLTATRLSLSAYLTYSLALHRRRLRRALRPSQDRLRQRYQARGLSLKPVYLRPANQTWTDLTQFSRYSGYSICFLFVILLRMEAAQVDGANKSGFALCSITFQQKLKRSGAVERSYIVEVAPPAGSDPPGSGG